MVRKIKWFFMAMLVISHAVIHDVYAISWVLADPEVNIERADIIAQGTFDFTKSKYRVPFRVIQVFKGEVPEKFEVVYDPELGGKLSHIQRRGGQVILFVSSNNKDGEYYVLGGENGYVPVMNGQIVMTEPERAEVFNRYFEEIGIPILNVKTRDPLKAIMTKVVPFFIGVAVVTWALWLLLRWRDRKIMSSNHEVSQDSDSAKD